MAALDLDLDLGVDLDVVDAPQPATAPTATDTGFLIHSTTQPGSPTDVQLVRSSAEAGAVYEGEVGLLAQVDAFFGAGGSRLYISPLGLDEVAAADLFGDQLGPGQLMAPEVVAQTDMIGLRDWAWEHNKFYLAQAPDGSTQAALETLQDGLVDASGGRFASLWADTLLIPGLAPGTTREVASSVVAAGLMARSDRVTGNPNLAAAGNHTPGAAGQADFVVGIKEERTLDEIKALARSQVNSFRTVNNRVRAYGFWTLADLSTLPQWWDISGSRLIMALRAEEAAAAEEMMFSQVGADGVFLDKYQGALSAVLARYQRMGAIYGTQEEPGYKVDVSAVVNPVENVARGLITAIIQVKSSPFAASLKLTLTRRQIAERVV